MAAASKTRRTSCGPSSITALLFYATTRTLLMLPLIAQLIHVHAEHFCRPGLVALTGVEDHVEVLFLLTGEVILQFRPLFGLAHPQGQLLGGDDPRFAGGNDL